MSELEPLALLSAEAAPGLALPPELRRDLRKAGISES